MLVSVMVALVITVLIPAGLEVIVYGGAMVVPLTLSVNSNTPVAQLNSGMVLSVKH